MDLTTPTSAIAWVMASAWTATNGPTLSVAIRHRWHSVCVSVTSPVFISVASSASAWKMTCTLLTAAQNSSRRRARAWKIRSDGKQQNLTTESRRTPQEEKQETTKDTKEHEVVRAQTTFVNLRVLCGKRLYFSAAPMKLPTSFFNSPSDWSCMYIMCPAP